VTTSEAAFINRLTAASGDLATDATVRMEATHPWFRDLSADDRAWVSLVAQAGISAFLAWVADPQEAPQLTADVFGSAPRELARIISLEQTVALVRTTIEVVESAIDELLEEPERSEARKATLQYSREIAFSAAEVYARAAEARGAWDARLEALVIDSIMREDADPSLSPRISALGWSDAAPFAVVTGYAPVSDIESSLDVLRRAARNHDLTLLTGMHGDFLISLIGHCTDDEYAARAARLITPHFGPGPVVLSEQATDIDDVGAIVRRASDAVRAAAGWPGAPRPVAATDLLPERAIAGDSHARAELIETAFTALSAEPHLLQTVEAFLERSPTLEGTARALFVHPNTVRYRLGRVADVTGFSPSDPRGALALRLSLILGRAQMSDRAL
jgi:hypothetical protein